MALVTFPDLLIILPLPCQTGNFGQSSRLTGKHAVHAGYSQTGQSTKAKSEEVGSPVYKAKRPLTGTRYLVDGTL